MRKDYCEKCEKEIKFKNCYEVSFGKVTDEQDGYWDCCSADNINLCPKCYKEFLALFKPNDASGGN